MNVAIVIFLSDVKREEEEEKQSSELCCWVKNLAIVVQRIDKHFPVDNVVGFVGWNRELTLFFIDNNNAHTHKKNLTKRNSSYINYRTLFTEEYL